MILLLSVFAGVKHISHLAILRTDNVLRKLFKWSKFPADCIMAIKRALMLDIIQRGRGKNLIIPFFVLLLKHESVFIIGFEMVQHIQQMVLLILQKRHWRDYQNEFGKYLSEQTVHFLMGNFWIISRKSSVCIW